MVGRGKRKIEASKEEAKKLKGLLKKCKNTVEIKRVNIMIVYLSGKNSSETSEILSVSKGTVQETIDKYIKDKENFYKTNYKGKIETEERKELKRKVKEIIERKIKEKKNPDINQVLKEVNEYYSKNNNGNPILNYNGIRRIIRKFFGYNYQKPFVKNNKQPENAEEIIKERLKGAIIDIYNEEKIDADIVAIKNKKTKFGRIIR